MIITDLNPAKYISRTNSGNYRVSKNINGKTTHFATFDSLEEAKKYRDYCIANDWDLNCKISQNLPKKEPANIYKTHNGKYAIIKTINYEKHYFGVFDTLDDAIKYKEYCIEHNWDLNCKITANSHEKQYICFQNGKYTIRKSINGKLKVFGRYDTLEEAIEHRNELINNNWNNSENNDEYTQRLEYLKTIPNIYYNLGKYVIRKYIKNQSVSFGAFDSLEEALKHKEYCEENNWDLNLRKRRNNPQKYIIWDKTIQRYVIRRKIDGKLVYFGSFETLEEAVAKKQELEANNWDIRLKQYKQRKYNLPKYITKSNNLFLLQKKFKDKEPLQICFKNLNEAVYERDLLKTVDWDIEELIALDEARGTL